MTPTQPQYLLFTSLVKHGELLRYLLAAQVRKRLMEAYGFLRQVKSSALTGNPDRVFEFYYVEEPDLAIRALNALFTDQAFLMSHQLIDDARIHSRITEDERIITQDKSNEAREQTGHATPRHMSLLEIPPPLQKLIQMKYLLETKSRQQCAQLRSEKPYLLQVTCTLLSNDMHTQFNHCMEHLIDIFDDSGLNLLIAGQHAGVLEFDPANNSVSESKSTKSKEPISILNVWEFEDPDSPKLLMSRLADNPTYSELDALCTQEQHICRNISRHYQRYPLLPGLPLTI